MFMLLSISLYVCLSEYLKEVGYMCTQVLYYVGIQVRRELLL